MVIKYIRKLLGGRKKTQGEGAGDKARTAAQPHQPAIHHRPIPENLIDPEAAKIVRRLRRFGHTAYIVGGGVRDLLLERTPKDFDISTSARPNEVRKLFRNCRIIGRRFRLAHIYFHDKIIEVATFRSNQPEDLDAAIGASPSGAEAGAHRGPRADERRGGHRRDDPRGGGPDVDHFARDEGDLLIRSDNVFGTPETDALRRDYTINALFYDIETGNVIDYVGGIPDLDKRLLRMIGDPEIRLREDPIRILRALRLAGRLGFTIDPATLEAIRRHRTEINRAAAPRILEDFLRIFRKGGAERAMGLMHELGVDAIVMPELMASPKPADRELLRKLLHSLDLATAKGTEFSNATILALVYYPFARHILNGQWSEGEAGYAAIDKMVGLFEQRLVVPKRDRDRIRLILLAQRRLVSGVTGSRKGSAGAFVRKPFFPEAFDLFDIITSATGEHRDELRRWKGRISSAAAASDGASLGPPIPSHPRTEQEGRGQGRRRGRRGRGGRGGQHEQGARGGQPQPRRAEPIVIPELGPGENPYGDAVLVAIPPAASDTSREPAGGAGGVGAGSHARRDSSAPHGGRRDATEGHARSESASGGILVSEGAGPGTGAPGQEEAAGSGRRRRRRRGGRGRRRKGSGGGGGAGGGAEGQNGRGAGGSEEGPGGVGTGGVTWEGADGSPRSEGISHPSAIER